uniref:26S proteasome non-ATPase regulatory subunit 8 n=1 Tax=Strongyloides papillosus TaxID=174720 RepID=A0A0N5BVQ4_STREA
MALERIYKDLLTEWSKTLAQRDPNVISKLLLNAKAELRNPEIFKQFKKDQCTQIHKDIFEIDALFRAGVSDMKGFKESISIVLNFYKSHPEASIDAFPNAHLLNGLYLMYLLTMNDLSTFHLQLEQISPDLQKNNPYISTPVKLEQYINEGAFNKVVLSEKTIPSPYFMAFVRILMDTVRDEIATNIEESFQKLSKEDARQHLHFTNDEELKAFAEKRNWKLDSSLNRSEIYVFNKAIQKTEEAAGGNLKLDTKRISEQTLFYAKQLEMIV